VENEMFIGFEDDAEEGRKLIVGGDDIREWEIQLDENGDEYRYNHLFLSP
jgi:hypothetical protein